MVAVLSMVEFASSGAFAGAVEQAPLTYRSSPTSHQSSIGDSGVATGRGQMLAQTLPTPYALTYSFDMAPVVFHFVASDLTFRIPRNYIDLPGRFKEEADVEDVLLFTLLPTVQGRTQDNDSEFRKGGNEAFLTILIKGPREEPWDLSRLARFHANEYPAPSPGYRHQRIDIVAGLNATRQIPPDPSDTRWRDIFDDKKDGGQTVSIVCRGEGTIEHPNCTHHFLYRSLLVQMTYFRSQLPNWREIQSSVQQKLNLWLTVNSNLERGMKCRYPKRI